MRDTCTSIERSKASSGCLDEIHGGFRARARGLLSPQRDQERELIAGEGAFLPVHARCAIPVDFKAPEAQERRPPLDFPALRIARRRAQQLARPGRLGQVVVGATPADDPVRASPARVSISTGVSNLVPARAYLEPVHVDGSVSEPYPSLVPRT